MDRGATLLTAEAGINAAAPPPGGLHADEPVRLDAVELLGLLLDDILVRGWSNS